MRTLLCWLVLIPMAAAADWKIDHATIAGPKLDRLRALLSSIGIPSEYGGPHSNGLTEMAITAFPDGSYLELIAWRDASAPHPGASWKKFMDSQGGPCAWAIHVDDVRAEASRLKVAGVETTDVARSGRTRPDGVKLEWETAGIGPGDRGSRLPFLIRDFTPRDRRVYPSGKPTTTEYKGIAQVIIAVRDLEAAVKLYRRAFALPEPDRRDDRELAGVYCEAAKT